MDVCLLYLLCCVGWDLCDGPITRPGESYRVYQCVVKCNNNAPLHLQGTEDVQSKQDRQCAYNVILRRVRVTIVAVEKQKVLLIGLCVHAWAYVRACGNSGACACAYGLVNPARNAYAPYCEVICCPSVTNTFFDISHKRCDIQKKLIENEMCVLIFSTTSV